MLPADAVSRLDQGVGEPVSEEARSDDPYTQHTVRIHFAHPVSDFPVGFTCSVERDRLDG